MAAVSLQETVEGGLWPLVDHFLTTQEAVGIAVAVVRNDEVVARGFGERDRRTGEPVTPRTMFHLASVSKPFVATAVVSLAAGGGLDLDAPVTDWVPELVLADGRAGEVTVRGLLSHTSGLPDVAEYGWHDPQLDDDALAVFAGSLSDWRLKSDPGAEESYSNAGYELLGLVLSRVSGTTFEDAVRRLVLAPLGMERSTFMRSEVPLDDVAAPHVGMPLQVPGDRYPYTRQHAPSSSLHSNLEELGHWVTAHLTPSGRDDLPRLDPALVATMREPVVTIGNPPWDESASLGWAMGSYRGHALLTHSGADPGFGSRVVILPDERAGVVVLANTNTVPASFVARAAIDLVLEDDPEGEGCVDLRTLRRPIAASVAESLAADGPAAAVATYHRLADADPVEVEVDDEGFDDAVWGAIELHRTDLAWPLLRVWTELRPESSAAWTMAGWAHQVDGDTAHARELLERALALDPDNDDAALIMSGLPPA
jgi:CubicO group peptidase (beta-lactamase class C family)